VDSGTAERIRALLRQELDWEYLLRTAHAHGVRPLLYRSLKTTCLEETPPAVMAQLHASFHANAAWNMLLASELIRLLRLLDSHGIRAVPYKGPALAAAVYGQLALRQIGDLDLIVRLNDVERAGGLLRAQGYRPETEKDGTGEGGVPGSRHVDAFRSANGQVLVELHWRIAPRHFAAPREPERWWERLQPLCLAGTTVESLMTEDLLLCLCVHGSKHGWERLLWIADIAELVRSQPGLDWSAVLEQARRSGCRRMLLLGLGLAHELLDAPLPDPVRDPVLRSRAVRSVVRRVRQRLFGAGDVSVAMVDGFMVRLGALERLPDGMRFALRILKHRFTPNSADRELLPLPAALTPLYYLLRPFRLAGLYARGRWKQSRRAGGS
jgi:hypothetical protein